MKGNLMSALVELDNETLQYLVAEVKETVATDVELVKPETSNIKVVDLWKMNKKRKSATRRFAQKRNHIPFI
jgi:hypothetical protein